MDNRISAKIEGGPGAVMNVIITTNDDISHTRELYLDHLEAIIVAAMQREVDGATQESDDALSAFDWETEITELGFQLTQPSGKAKDVVSVIDGMHWNQSVEYRQRLAQLAATCLAALESLDRKGGNADAGKVTA